MRTRMTTAILIAVAALMAACSTTTSTDDGFNAADVSFAQEMIPHHRQATEMAALAASRTDDAEVLDLADRIAGAQEPEITTMTSWLDSWDEKVPTTMSSMDSMPGMMSDDQMSALRASSGATFDRQFLSMMIEHHSGAIEMATTEQSDGDYADAVKLAATIETDQTAEIAQMRRLLGS